MSTGISVSAQSRDRSRNTSIAGKVETFADGRQRSIVTVGEVVEIPFTLVLVTMPQIDQLRAWYGTTLEWRDHRGQRYVGVIFDLKISEYIDNIGFYDAASTFRTVTFVEGV
jgi:hypothetical protein